MSTVLVFATNDDLYAELVTAAEQVGDDVVAAALGPAAENAEGLVPGASTVYTATGDGLDEYHVEPVANALAEIVDEAGADHVLVGGNRRGKEIGPQLAAKLDAGYIVNALEIPEEGTFRRKFMGGKTMANEAPQTGSVVATIAPHSFEPHTGEPGPVETIQVSPGKGRVERVSLEERDEEGVNIEEADTVVAFGRGVEEEDDMEVVFDTAESMGGVVGCSRPISADMHWLGDDRWIGLSGKVVTPKVYVAAGISCQIQHLAGCRDSELIVVVNTDENAPFFDHADYGLVGDLYDVLPAITEKLS
jgi:electron transfer flavoprotein alpha subunit